MNQKRNKNIKIQRCVKCTVEFYNHNTEENNLVELYIITYILETDITDQIKTQKTSYYVTTIRDMCIESLCIVCQYI